MGLTPVLPFLKELLRKDHWDEVSINGEKIGKLDEDVEVGMGPGHVWIRFQFHQGGRETAIEGRVGFDGTETILRNDKPEVDSRIAVEPIAQLAGAPPKAKSKLAVFLIYGELADRSVYRFDVTMARS